MPVVELQEYDGIVFRRYPEAKQKSHRRYFQKHTKWKQPPIYLHRYVWEKHNGKIPEGNHVHHRDGNTANNDISNLECLTCSAHYAEHSESRSAYGKSEAQIKHLSKIRELTKKWHASPEGIEWHRQNGKKSWKNKKYSEANCVECGIEFKTFIPSRAKFCSSSCSNRNWHKENYKKKT